MRQREKHIARRTLVRGIGMSLSGVGLAGCGTPDGGEDDGEEEGEGGGEGEEGEGGEEQDNLRQPAE